MGRALVTGFRLLFASVPQLRAIRARLPLAAMEALAAHPAVQAIKQADRAYTRKLDTSEGDGAHFADEIRPSEIDSVLNMVHQAGLALDLLQLRRKDSPG